MKSRVLNDPFDEMEQWNSEDASELERPKAVDKYKIVVASRDWTVETIVRQVEQEHIDLDPALQRRNAWRDHRRSRLIEPFILGFPVPQLVLAENPRSRGKFIVIDGKQRLMTIAGLYLPTYNDYWDQPRFSGLGVLTDLNGTPLKAFLEESQYAKERRELGNADIRTTVISGFTDEDASLELLVTMRHQWAHQDRRRAKVVRSAKDAQTTVSDCLALAERLSVEVASVRP